MYEIFVWMIHLKSSCRRFFRTQMGLPLFFIRFICLTNLISYHLKPSFMITSPKFRSSVRILLLSSLSTYAIACLRCSPACPMDSSNLTGQQWSTSVFFPLLWFLSSPAFLISANDIISNWVTQAKNFSSLLILKYFNRL